MQPTKLTDRAHALLDQAGLNLRQNLDAGKHSLSAAQVVSILKLSAINPEATQAEIAAAVGCSQQSVSRYLAAYHDTVDVADKFLKVNALPAAAKAVQLMDHDNGKVALEASKTVLKAVKLLDAPDTGKVSVGVQVVIGVPGQPAGPDPLATAHVTPEAIEATFASDDQ